jgi:hypothetical protein
VRRCLSLAFRPKAFAEREPSVPTNMYLSEQPGIALRWSQGETILTMSPGAAPPPPGCGRPSSAVLGFEYGLPSPQLRPLRSLAGRSALLPASSLLFFPPIAVFVVLH